MILKLRVFKFQFAIEMYRFWLKWGVKWLLVLWHSRDMVISLIFSLLSHFFAKNGWFWGWYWSLEFSIFQSTIEMYLFWLKWGVNWLLTMCYPRDMVFSSIFSHFCHFLAKNGSFWGWCQSLEFLIFQSTIEMYRFWFSRCSILEIWYFPLFNTFHHVDAYTPKL